MSARALSAQEQDALTAKLSAAWDEIEANPRRALEVFVYKLPIWDHFSKQSFGYIDADRGSLIAAVLAMDHAAADTAWARISAESKEGAVAERAPRGDALAWSRQWSAAFRSYRAGRNFGLVPISPLIQKGLSEAIDGSIDKAIGTWSLPAEGFGTSDLGDVQLALIGIAYASRGEWAAAKRNWIAAAQKRRTAPQFEMLYAGNVMALSMIYHFQREMRSVEAARY
jgi:hypothetical protein